MNSENSSNQWEKISIDTNLIRNTLNLANRDLTTAKNLFKDKQYDWCFAISYNAMLQAGRALMFSKGYRPKGEFKHVAVIEFIKKTFGKEFAEQLLFQFNKIRKKRHIIVYEQINLISQEEAENAQATGEELLKKVHTFLKIPREELSENKKPTQEIAGKEAEQKMGKPNHSKENYLPAPEKEKGKQLPKKP